MRRWKLTTVLAALGLAGALWPVTAGAAGAAAPPGDGAAASAFAAQASAPAGLAAARAGVVDLTSGVDGEGLLGAVDDRTGEPLEVHPVTPRFTDAYATIPGARWISDRFGPAIGDGTYQQARAYENATGATIDPRPRAVCLPDGTCADLGDAWHSRRTFRTSFTLPAGTAATDVTLQLAVDNVATVILDAGDGAARRTVVAASCDTFASCTAAGPTGEGHFRTAATVAVDPGGIGAGVHTLDFVVDDWGSVTGLVYKLTAHYADTAASGTCTPRLQESCSLTVTPTPPGPDGASSGTVRFCYSPPDDQPRTVLLRDADGLLRPFTLEPHTWVDTPTPVDGIVRYPTELDAVPLDDLLDRGLTRCPGAVPPR